MSKLPRLPFAPLVDWTLDVDEQTGATELARVYGVTAEYIHRWRREGMTLRAAENACDHAHVHPCGVWGDDWIDLALNAKVKTISRERSTHCAECGAELPTEDARPGPPRQFCPGTDCSRKTRGRRRRDRTVAA